MNFSKKMSVLFLFLGLSLAGNAQEKPLSPPAEAKGNVNGANITISYSSPSVKGREIWGKLVPFNEVWRAGANKATVFATDKDLMIEGTKLPAGKYGFFVIPNKEECTIIFNKVSDQWGAYDYDASKDQLRVKVKPLAVAASAEQLAYKIDKDKITLSWEKWNIPFKVK